MITMEQTTSATVTSTDGTSDRLRAGPAPAPRSSSSTPRATTASSPRSAASSASLAARRPTVYHYDRRGRGRSCRHSCRTRSRARSTTSRRSSMAAGGSALRVRLLVRRPARLARRREPGCLIATAGTARAARSSADQDRPGAAPLHRRAHQPPSRRDSPWRRGRRTTSPASVFPTTRLWLSTRRSRRPGRRWRRLRPPSSTTVMLSEAT